MSRHQATKVAMLMVVVVVSVSLLMIVFDIVTVGVEVRLVEKEERGQAKFLIYLPAVRGEAGRAEIVEARRQ